MAFQYKGCTTRGCQEHLEHLSNTLNKTVDPCRDPMAYVCDKVRWRSEIVSDALTDTLVRWYELGATFLEKQRRPSPASALYQGCVSRKGHTYERLEEVLSFLRDRGLHWPQRVTGVGATKHALNVILDLLINWGVPFWLEISLKQLPGDTRYSLHMAYSEVSLHRAKWVNYSKARGKRLEYVRTMYRLYEAGDTPLAQLRDLVADEDAWVRAVTEGIASSNRVIMKLRLAHLDQLTPNVSSHRWLDYLNEHLPLTGRQSASRRQDCEHRDQQHLREVQQRSHLGAGRVALHRGLLVRQRVRRRRRHVRQQRSRGSLQAPQMLLVHREPLPEVAFRVEGR
ncbi:uncharacterized protein [Dermacentor albipictus]